MNRAKTSADAGSYQEAMSHNGLRLTRQRREVYDVILQERDHPTATDVFMRVQKNLPGISLATVYNCLETLSDCGLVRQVHFDRSPTRFCPNLQDHAHFHCDRCGKIVDVPVSSEQLPKVPPGFVVTSVTVNLRGYCDTCSNAS